MSCRNKVFPLFVPRVLKLKMLRKFKRRYRRPFNRVNGFRKRYVGNRRASLLNRAQRRLEKKVSEMKRKVDKRVIRNDVETNLANPDTWYGHLFNQISGLSGDSQTGKDTRTGLGITVKSIAFRGYVSCMSSCRFRVVVVVVKQICASVPAAVFHTVSDLDAHYNIHGETKYKVLYDKCFSYGDAVHDQARVYRPLNLKFKFPGEGLKVLYKSVTSNDWARNGVYMYVCRGTTVTTSGLPSWSGIAQTKFVDQ